MRMTTDKTWMAVALALMASAAAAADWPQWRGPARDGRLEKPPVAAWPEGLTRVWKVEVGEGHSSPLVVGDRVFIFSRQGEDEILRALALADGKELWKVSYPAPYTMNPVALPHGKGPKSTPAAADGKICTLGISGILSCFEQKDGALAWRKDYSSFQQDFEFCGHGLSPLIDRGTVYVNYGSDKGGAIGAYELATGKVRWEAKDIKPSYASPMIFELGGKRQLVTLTYDTILGLDSADGTILWQYPYADQYRQNIPTPLLVGDMLFFGNIENGSFGGRLVAKEGGGWQLQETWKQADLPWYMSSPVSDGKVVVAFTSKGKGQLVALEPATGKIVWRGPGRQGENALLTLAGDQLLVVDTNGEFKVWNRAGEGWELARTYTVADSPIWAHPAFAGDLLVVKDAASVLVHRLAAPPAPPEQKAP